MPENLHGESETKLSYLLWIGVFGQNRQGLQQLLWCIFHSLYKSENRGQKVQLEEPLKLPLLNTLGSFKPLLTNLKNY